MLQAGGSLETVVSQVHGVTEAGVKSSLLTVYAVASPESQPPTERLQQFLNCFLNFVAPLLLSVP